MTDKQIIIDGVNVSELTSDQLACMNRYEIAHLFIKLVETLIRTEDDYNTAQEDRVKMWTDNTELTEKLKRKERECEMLKYNNGYEVGALERTIDNLKSELDKLKQTLINIKEIAKKSDMPPCLNIDCSCEKCKDGTTEKGSRCMQYGLVKILQKISEVQNAK